MCGTSSSLNSFEAQNLSGAPALHGLWLLPETILQPGRRAHLPTAWTEPPAPRGNLINTAHPGKKLGRILAQEFHGILFFFFNNMLQTGNRGHSDFAHKGESRLI